MAKESDRSKVSRERRDRFIEKNKKRDEAAKKLKIDPTKVDKHSSPPKDK